MYPEESVDACEDSISCGDVYIESADDAAEYSKCEVVNALDVHRMSSLENLSFPCLRTINGSFTIEPQLELESIHMPELVTIGEHLSWRGLRVTEIEMGRLTDVNGGISLYALHEATGLDWISSLTTVNESMLIYENPKVESLVGLSCLQSVNEDFLVRCNELMTDEHAWEFANSISIGGESVIEHNGPSVCGGDDDDTT